WGDYDNDGDLDIVLIGDTSFASPAAKVYRNDNGIFTEVDFSLSGVWNGTVLWGDYDNDGDLDVILSGTADSGVTNYTKIYRNEQGNSFTDIDALLPGVEQSSLALGDYDNDGDLDILLLGYSIFIGGSTTKIFQNNMGNFTEMNTQLPAVYYGSGKWGDYDADGDLDILLTGNHVDPLGTTIPLTVIYRNEGGNFENIHASFIPLFQSSVAWGDYDNDGDLDVVLCGMTGSYEAMTKVYRNDNGDFQDLEASLQGAYGGSVEWADFDNDSDLDILLAGISNDSFIVRIYRNNISANNAVPASPSGLGTQVVGNSVTLQWNKSTDDQTPQDGLTYNIRLGTTPNGIQIVSPMADVVNGYRKVPAMGNTNLRNSWIIRNLLPGTYYWSVQTIDNTFAGSSFTGVDSFVIISSDKEDELDQIPKEYWLSQNYPNPFNPLTVIRYQLPVQSKVSLKVYNLLGQVVKVLVDQVQDVGFKSVEWKPENVPSGVYFYRLQTEKFIDVKKMILIQ
ncbi:MAG: T9SS type A sorting domain-containing protein, partial [Ignavibacteriae bacterium]|nr:T9SS type A sorting domain-containing protein [Ignavibacteriota bacterium]